jgi:hypothetical protein
MKKILIGCAVGVNIITATVIATAHPIKIFFIVSPTLC